MEDKHTEGKKMYTQYHGWIEKYTTRVHRVDMGALLTSEKTGRAWTAKEQKILDFSRVFGTESIHIAKTEYRIDSEKERIEKLSKLYDKL